MMSIDYMLDLARDAGKAAKRAGTEPAKFSEDEIKAFAADPFKPARKIPNLGDYTPKGWKRVDIEAEGLPVDPSAYRKGIAGEGLHSSYFVDSSGFGQEGELALTIQQFAKLVKPDYGYGLVITGQFQVQVGVFKPTSNAARGSKRRQNGWDH